MADGAGLAGGIKESLVGAVVAGTVGAAAGTGAALVGVADSTLP